MVTGAAQDAGAVACRSLHRLGYTVVGIDTAALPLGLHSRYCTRLLVAPARHDPAHDGWMLATLARLQPRLLLIVGQAGIAFAGRHAAVVAPLTGHTLAPPEAIEAALDKQTFHQECRRLGLPVPRHYGMPEAMKAIARDGDLTLVVKPCWEGGASRGVAYVHTPAQLQAAWHQCRREHGAAVIQEFVSGDAAAMGTAVLLFDHRTHLVAAFCAGKRRQWPPSGGLSVISEAVQAPDLIERVLPLFRHWRWRGAAEVEFKRNTRTGEFTVIEVNPRLPGYIRFPALCGVDFPALLARLARGEQLPELVPARMAPPPPRTYVAPGLLLRSLRAGAEPVPRQGCRQRWRHLRNDLGSWREAARCLRDMAGDPLPFLARQWSHAEG